MIDKKIFIDNLDVFIKALENRNCKVNLEKILSLVKEELKIKQEIEKFNEKRNLFSKQIAILVAENKKCEINKVKKNVLLIKEDIDKLSEKYNLITNELNDILATIPNIPHKSVPIGKDENHNVEIKHFLESTKFDFPPKNHWDIAIEKDLISFDNAAKITGSRFVIYKGKGAKLIRALQQFTLDSHILNGYIELAVPVIVNSLSLFRTGQLPKFKEDLFAINDSNYYLSPTLEVQLTNFYSDQILKSEDLPIKLTGSSLNFRAEAGAAGKDTKGVIRQHQFYKTEMVNISHPNNSYEILENLTMNAEKIMEDLNLPYRRILLCTGDMGFSSAKTYDLEVWLPSYNGYKEISSCSNCESFQARRAMIRFKNIDSNKNELVHTLNGSGLAIDRLWAAIIENNQQKDGTIKIPKPLIKYTGFDLI